MPEPRLDLINHLKQQIADGTYETDGKLRIAADQMLARIRASDPTSWPIRPTDRDESDPSGLVEPSA